MKTFVRRNAQNVVIGTTTVSDDNPKIQELIDAGMVEVNGPVKDNDIFDGVKVTPQPLPVHPITQATLNIVAELDAAPTLQNRALARLLRNSIGEK